MREEGRRRKENGEVEREREREREREVGGELWLEEGEKNESCG